MRRIRKQVTEYDNIFLSADGEEFSFAADARERDIEILEAAIADLPSLDKVLLPLGLIRWQFYQVSSDAEEERVMDYLEAKYGDLTNRDPSQADKPDFPYWCGVTVSLGASVERDIRERDAISVLRMKDAPGIVSDLLSSIE